MFAHRCAINVSVHNTHSCTFIYTHTYIYKVLAMGRYVSAFHIFYFSVEIMTNSSEATKSEIYYGGFTVS